MRNKFVFRMYIILVISTVVVAIGVDTVVTTLSYNAMTSDAQERANGIKDYILDFLTMGDLVQISQQGAEGDVARTEMQEKLNALHLVGNLTHLYLAVWSDTGEIVTTQTVQNESGALVQYFPTGDLAEDLQKSFTQRIAIMSNSTNIIGYGSEFAIYWPMLNETGEILAVVCMEFSMEAINESFKDTAIYSLILSGAMVIIFSVISYLSMSRASELMYKRLAYTDFLTGAHNRLAYEQRLVSCESVVARGGSVALIMFDINKLKYVNDTMGHKAGDKYIIGTVERIKKILGNQGALYRIGGDEFAAILIDRGVSEINHILDALGREKDTVAVNMPFSCAFGASVYTPGVDRDLQDLAHRADTEMYGNKRNQKERDAGGKRRGG